MISGYKPSQMPRMTAHALLHSAVMYKLLALGVSLPLLACVVGSDAPTGDDTAVHISSNMTAPATFDIAKPTIVDANIILTIPAGATVKFAPSASLEVRGTVLVQGLKASPVQLSPATTGGTYGGLSVPAGGTLTMSYAVQVGGPIEVNGGTLTVTDSLMSQSLGDFLTVGAGKATVSFSAIGIEPGAGTNTIHCNMHFGGTGTTISITHSTIAGSPYGLMLYGGTNVDLTSNNWISNGIQVDTSPGVVGDVSNGFFDKNPPTPVAGSTLTRNTLSATRLPPATTDPVNGTGPR
jgi:hypothetical protein